jgi:hypothetical protein
MEKVTDFGLGLKSVIEQIMSCRKWLKAEIGRNDFADFGFGLKAVMGGEAGGEYLCWVR